MINKYETKELKLNTPLSGKLKGSIVKIKVDNNGIPIDKYWRRRIKDAKIDHCVEFVGPKKRSSKKENK